jgi:hypothetical protein
MLTGEKGKQKWYKLCSSSVYYQHLIPFSPKTPQKQLFSHERASTSMKLTYVNNLEKDTIPHSYTFSEPLINSTQSLN